jgi:hypothetical protein
VADPGGLGRAAIRLGTAGVKTGIQPGALHPPQAAQPRDIRRPRRRLADSKPTRRSSIGSSGVVVPPNRPSRSDFAKAF